MTRSPILLLSLFCLISSACFSQADTTRLSADEFEKRVSKDSAQLIDVRTPQEHKEGHIKNSRLANWNEPDDFKAGIQRLDRSKPVYLYCRKGPRSHAAAAYLRKNGFAQVYELSGGIDKWNEAKKPLQE